MKKKSSVQDIFVNSHNKNRSAEPEPLFSLYRELTDDKLEKFIWKN